MANPLAVGAQLGADGDHLIVRLDDVQFRDSPLRLGNDDRSAGDGPPRQLHRMTPKVLHFHNV
jgi:hypothetical protein